MAIYTILPNAGVYAVKYDDGKTEGGDAKRKIEDFTGAEAGRAGAALVSEE